MPTPGSPKTRVTEPASRPPAEHPVDLADPGGHGPAAGRVDRGQRRPAAAPAARRPAGRRAHGSSEFHSPQPGHRPDPALGRGPAVAAAVGARRARAMAGTLRDRV